MISQALGKIIYIQKLFQWIVYKAPTMFSSLIHSPHKRSVSYTHLYLSLDAQAETLSNLLETHMVSNHVIWIEGLD